MLCEYSNIFSGEKDFSTTEINIDRIIMEEEKETRVMDNHNFVI